MHDEHQKTHKGNRKSFRIKLKHDVEIVLFYQDDTPEIREALYEAARESMFARHGTRKGRIVEGPEWGKRENHMPSRFLKSKDKPNDTEAPSREAETEGKSTEKTVKEAKGLIFTRSAIERGQSSLKIDIGMGALEKNADGLQRTSGMDVCGLERMILRRFAKPCSMRRGSGYPKDVTRGEDRKY